VEGSKPKKVSERIRCVWPWRCTSFGMWHCVPGREMASSSGSSPWRWRHYDPPKCRELTAQRQGVTSHKTWMRDITTMMASNLALIYSGSDFRHSRRLMLTNWIFLAYFTLFGFRWCAISVSFCLRELLFLSHNSVCLAALGFTASIPRFFNLSFNIIVSRISKVFQAVSSPQQQSLCSSTAFI
jgi:hypothetical protein